MLCTLGVSYWLAEVGWIDVTKSKCEELTGVAGVATGANDWTGATCDWGAGLELKSYDSEGHREPRPAEYIPGIIVMTSATLDAVGTKSSV